MEPKIDMTDIHMIQEQLSYVRWVYWRENVLFSPIWWLLLINTLVVIGIWWRFVDRKRIGRILLFGFIVFSSVMFLDMLGGELQWWDYPSMVLPWGARVISVDIMIAIYFMLIYQKFRRWRSFILASVIMATFFAFVFEPLARMINIYEPIRWKYVYSIPIYTALSAAAKWIAEKIHTIQQQATES